MLVLGVHQSDSALYIRVCVYMLSHVWPFCDSMNYSPPGSSVHGIFQARYWSGLPFPLWGGLSKPGIEPKSLESPPLAGVFFSTVPSGEPFIYVLFQILSPWRLSQNTEHSPLMSASLYCLPGDEALGNSRSGPKSCLLLCKVSLTVLLPSL